MSNETKIVPVDQGVSTPGGQYTQTGNNNLLVVNYGSFNNYEGKQDNSQPVGNLYVPQRVDTEYYNLFVVCDEDFAKPYFKVPRERSLNDYMDDKTKNLFATLTPEAKERIKTMPSLFMNENDQYGQAGDNQCVMYGFVSDIEECEICLKIFHCSYQSNIPQQLLNEHLKELALVGNSCFNELNRTHWSIKYRNLIQVLTGTGIQLLTFGYH